MAVRRYMSLTCLPEDILYRRSTVDVHARGGRELLAFAQSVFDDFPVSSFQVEHSACQGQRGFLDWTWVAEDGITERPRIRVLWHRQALYGPRGDNP